MEKVPPIIRQHVLKIVATLAFAVLAGWSVLLGQGLDQVKSSADDAYALADQRGNEIEELRRELANLDGEDVSDRVDALEGRVSNLEDALGHTSRFGSGLYSLEDRVSRLERENRYRY